MSGPVDSGDKDVYDDINITPMLDLAYVLMVIFIIMTTASVQGIKVNLPKASDTPSLAKPQTKAITITADGTMYLDTYPVSLPELEKWNPAMLPVTVSITYSSFPCIAMLTGRTPPPDSMSARLSPLAVTLNEVIVLSPAFTTRTFCSSTTLSGDRKLSVSMRRTSSFVVPRKLAAGSPRGRMPSEMTVACMFPCAKR